MTKNLNSNIWKFTFLLISNKRIFAAILGAYYLTVPEVTAQTLGTILLAGSVSGFLFEIPSGYLSDKIGHKQALVVSRILMLLSTVFFLVGTNVVFLLLGAALMHASNAFHSGTGSAFMHDTLRSLGRDQDYTKIMGKVSAIGFAVPIIFTVLTPFLVGISFKAPFLFSLVIDGIGLAFSLILISPPGHQAKVEEIRATNFWQVLKEGHRLNFFQIALISAVISGTLFGVGGFRGPYQVFLEIPVIWFGVLFGAGRAMASLMLAYSGRIKKYFTLVSFYQSQVILFGLFFLLLGYLTTWWAVAVVFIIMNAFKWGLNRIDEGYQLDLIRSSKFKATLLSVATQIDQAIGAVVGFGLGFLIEQMSYRTGFLVVAIVFLIIQIPLCISISFKYKNRRSAVTETTSAELA
ncbi:MFS transporter [Candidatus Gracilibacteria bacterium]|nr:MFS transporter [Candidatus Gracilibacteria bacterium]